MFCHVLAEGTQTEDTEEGIVKKTKKQALKTNSGNKPAGAKKNPRKTREKLQKSKPKNQKATGKESRNMDDMKGENAEPWRTDTGSTYTPTTEE